MSTTGWGAGSNNAVKLWSKRLMSEALRQTWLYKFMGTSDDSMIQVLDDTQKGPGDQITYQLRAQLSSVGVIGDGTLEGNEETMNVYTDSMIINQLRNAVRSSGKMSEQRVPFSVREEMQKALSDWYAGVFDLGGFNQLIGLATATPAQAGLQTPTAPTNVILANSSTTASVVSAGASASNVFNLKLIDYALEQAKLDASADGTGYPLRPIKIDGSDYFVCFLHPYQVTAMRTSTTAAQWFDIQQAVLQGGGITNNPIFTGSLGVYNGVIFHETARITRDADGAYRAILCGAQAAVLAFGQDNAGNKVSWVEELFDYGNQLGVSAGMIWGLKKTVFNALDFGVITIYTTGVANGGI